MLTIVLPDGSNKIFDTAVSVVFVAKSISNSLAKSIICAKVDNKLVDSSYIINKNCNLQIITTKDQEALEVIRHSCAHLLAQAVKELFPTTQISIGPVIKDGFYYDFAYKAGFSDKDLLKIEQKMQALIKENLTISRVTMSRNEAVSLFTDMGENYKVEIIKSIAENEKLSLYKQGDFIDLCRGPHLSSTAKIKAFKLTKLAGAYWRGDSNNEMLQRIYGVAFTTKEELKNYLIKIAEAKKRDHRVIAKTQNLFHQQEEAPGMIFWHEQGFVMYQIIESYMRNIFYNNNYKEVKTPQLIDRSLWEKSGHWDKFSDHMFVTNSENRQYAVKPMNCPAHIQIYNQGLKSYRDLPFRICEFGSCHRNEPSGTLHGIMRVRNFTQDDGHIFCTKEQIADEVSKFIDLTFSVYKHFGFNNISIKLSTRPDKRVGSDEIWDEAEQALEDILNIKKINWQLQQGEGAFYGPKIEFILEDCLERQWQCGTLQVDFSMPERLGAKYIAEDGTKQVPVMLHRAIIGSLERFIGILIEHYAGSYPIWLAPTQAVILNISQKQQDFVLKIEKKLKESGIRVFSDLRNEKIGFKIREHSVKRYPYIIIIGDNEVENNKITVRDRNGKNLDQMSVGDFVALIKNK